MFETKKEIIEWLDLMGIQNYSINSDLSVDVKGDVNIQNKSLYRIPVKFSTVTGFFNCSHNFLVNLENSPNSVNYFICVSNQLTRLKGSPQNVDGIFSCGFNKLSTLLDGPQTAGMFLCQSNQLKSLKYGPIEVEGNYDCSHNELTNFEGITPLVGTLTSRNNKIESFHGLPLNSNANLVFKQDNQFEFFRPHYDELQEVKISFKEMSEIWSIWTKTQFHEKLNNDLMQKEMSKRVKI